MRILIVTPVPPQSRQGNRVTAVRWAYFLRDLGHRVEIAVEYDGRKHDILLALHARKSHAAVARWAKEQPGKPILLALTGTDVYGDIHTSEEARESLALATRLIVLQPLAHDELPPQYHEKVRVVYQSVDPPRSRLKPLKNVFEVCVMGHLRPVKDPFRTAEAARLLPASSCIRVLHLGGALSEEMAKQARDEEERNPRYRWLGEKPRGQAMRLLSRCRLLALTSHLEGGANVIGEAMSVSVPVVSSHIAGSVGLLGEDYPGYFPVGDTKALADLLHQVETEKGFYRELRRGCKRQENLFRPALERATWKRLLSEPEA